MKLMFQIAGGVTLANVLAVIIGLFVVQQVKINANGAAINLQYDAMKLRQACDENHTVEQCVAYSKSITK
jgi:hypothetical protein